MLFDSVLGHEHIIAHLKKGVDSGRIPHAQLFVGPEGAGMLSLAIAYAEYILCNSALDPKKTAACSLKFEQLAHPDLHFAFPVATTTEVKTKPTSDAFMKPWREFVLNTPFGDLFDWLKHIDLEKKQGIISVNEAADINKKLALKAYEGGYKVMLIWQADSMNTEAANKLLKLIEEPPEKTVFILITSQIDGILQTIQSRCQRVDFLALSEDTIAKSLIKNEGCETALAKKLAHQCNANYNQALHLLHKDEADFPFETWFIEWVRAAFRAKGNASVINDLIDWSEKIAALGRSVQKEFLHYCIQFFRQALLTNYQTEELVFLETETPKFNLKNFAPYVNGANINLIFEELEKAIYHIERNGNAKLILTDLSIQLTRLIHKKQ